MSHSTGNECITLEQLNRWYNEDDKDKMGMAAKNATECTLCKRVWLKFWAELGK
jgi:hypothetical protein